MGRAPRIEFAGALYHVMSRGNRQEAIYRDDGDCRTFMDTLGEACGRTGWAIHAYVLMGNHYHLLLETPEPNLVDGMRWLQGTYTKRFNVRHKQWGHLLQGRYKALPIDPQRDYFGTVGNYIHLNPARARRPIPGGLEEYPWSSYPAYLSPSARPKWLEVGRLLGAHRLEDRDAGRAAYSTMMRGRVSELASSGVPSDMEKKWAQIRRGWTFGSDAFREEMLERMEQSTANHRRNSYSGDAIRGHDTLEAEKLLQSGLQKLGLERDGLETIKKGDPRKKVVAWAIRTNTCVRNEWISKQLHMGNPSNLSRYFREVSKAEQGPLFEMRLKMTE